MRNNLTVFIVVFCSLLASCQAKFDKQVWQENNDVSKIKNPRKAMVDDLKANYLKIDMQKKDIITLLGKPYKDTISPILPRGLQLPDSLKIDYAVKQSDEKRKESLAKLNEWFAGNNIFVPLLKYPIGWSLIDPIFLEIRLNEEDKIVDFWVAQH